MKCKTNLHNLDCIAPVIFFTELTICHLTFYKIAIVSIYQKLTLVLALLCTVTYNNDQIIARRQFQVSVSVSAIEAPNVDQIVSIGTLISALLYCPSAL